MRRGGLLLCTALVVILWFVAPAVGAQSDEPPVPTTVAPASPTIAPTTVATAESALPDDPAAKRLRLVVYGLLGLGGLILVGTAVFWKATRPPLLLPATGSSKPATAAAKGAAAAATAGGTPAKIPASVVLASPAGAPLPTMAAVAARAVATVSSPAAVPAVDPQPPSGAPAIDAPPPLDDIPLGAQKPLVGADSAWIIEPESSSGLIAATPSAVDFPEPAEQPDEAPEEELPAETRALISALSAIPDKEPTMVRFDDPPVERVPPRPTRPAPEAEPETPEPPAAEAPAAEAPAEPTKAPAGAPGFDRIAREQHDATAQQRRVVDDMALMASALSSLPSREARDTDEALATTETGEVAHIADPVDVPPVGDFYDQDLDPGDPPGR